MTNGTIALIDRIKNGKTLTNGTKTFYKPVKADFDTKKDGLFTDYKKACKTIILDIDKIMLENKDKQVAKSVKRLDAFTSKLIYDFGITLPDNLKSNTFADVLYLWTSAHKTIKGETVHNNFESAIGQYLYAHINGFTMTEMLKNSDFNKEHQTALKVLNNINDMLTRQGKVKPLEKSFKRLDTEFKGHFTADELKAIHEKIVEYRDKETKPENAIKTDNKTK